MNIKKAVLASALVITSIQLFAQNYKRPANRPNIIYIYADDMGYGETEPYGQTKIHTPNLNTMAKEGMTFTQHYTSTPVCAPARCMLLTGKHGGHSYIRGNYEMGGFTDESEGGQMPLPENTFTIAKMLKSAGYSTGVTGKWGLGMAGTSGNPLLQGFDYFYGYADQKQAHNYYPTHLWENDHLDKLDNPKYMVHKRLDSAKATDEDFEQFSGKDYAPAKMTDKALKFINNHKDKPFFLYIPYTIPHVALQAPQPYVDQYIGKFPNERPYYGQDGYAPSKYPLSTYAAMITFLDEQVGIVMKRIKELGLDEHTIIMFSSDNGPTFNGGVDAKFFNSSGGLRGLKMDVFEGGIREPFIARWPGKIKANTKNDFISAQFDMMATFAEITGTKAIATDGLSLWPTLTGDNRKQVQHEYLYFEYPEKGGQLAIRMGDWKGVKIDLRKNQQNPWMIFNLMADKFESKNIAAQHPELVKKFDEIVKREHQRAHINEWEFLDNKMPKKVSAADVN